MNVQAHLDVDLVALEATDRITLMLDLTAPMLEAAKTRPGQAVQIVLDRSGSMEGEAIDSAKESLLKLVDRLASQDSFGLVAFDDTALVVVPMRGMADHHLPSVRKVIREMRTGGSTDISAGYLMGLRELTRVSSAAGSTLLLISDGHANAGEQDPSVFAGIATKSVTNRITTSTIGLGHGYDETILEALSQGGGGQHRFANSVDEAVGAIAAEVKDLLEKSAVNAVLRLTPVAGLAGAPRIDILQRLPHWMDGLTYVVQLGDILAGENRRFVIDIEVPGIAALGLCRIADITVEYLNLAEMSEVIVTMPVHVNVVPDDVAKGRVPNPVVRAERLILQAQTEKATAIDEIRSGDSKSASTRLKGLAAHLRREASQIPVTDERSAESLEIIKTEADEIDVLADSAEFHENAYSSKRLTESFSRNSRSRKVRPASMDPDANPSEELI